MGDGKGGGRDAHRHRHRHSHTWSPAYLEARRLYRTLQTLHIQTDTALTFCVHVCDCVFIHACVRACVCVCVYERVRMGVHIFIHAHNQSSRLACRGDRQPQPCERGAGCHLQTHSPPAQTGFTAHTSTSTHAYIHTYIPQYLLVLSPKFSLLGCYKEGTATHLHTLCKLVHFSLDFRKQVLFLCLNIQK